MPEKVIFTHVSAKALKGIRRLSRAEDRQIMAAPSVNGYTVVMKMDAASPSAKVVQRKRAERLAV